MPIDDQKALNLSKILEYSLGENTFITKCKDLYKIKIEPIPNNTTNPLFVNDEAIHLENDRQYLAFSLDCKSCKLYSESTSQKGKIVNKITSNSELDIDKAYQICYDWALNFVKSSVLDSELYKTKAKFIKERLAKIELEMKTSAKKEVLAEFGIILDETIS